MGKGRSKTEHGRRVQLNIKVSEAEAALIEEARGDTPVGVWLRDAALARAREVVSLRE